MEVMISKGVSRQDDFILVDNQFEIVEAPYLGFSVWVGQDCLSHNKPEFLDILEVVVAGYAVKRSRDIIQRMFSPE